MEKVLLSYALAKSMYDVGKDYFETFIPFILKIIIYDGYSLDKIKYKLKEEYFLDVPDHVLDEISKRAINRGFIEFTKGKYYITKEGNSCVSKFIEEREIKRRANYLAEKFATFLNQEVSDYVSSEQSLRILLNFINSNLIPLANFIISPVSLPREDEEHIYSRVIIKFLHKIEESDPLAYEILSDLFYGSVICTLVQARDGVPQTLKNIDVFLDTNTMFSMLGLHHEEINRPCQELLSFLKNEKCNLYIFNFTLDEIVYVLSQYSKNYKMILENVRINSIYSSLKMMGKTPSDVRSMIADLEGSLYEMGIKVFKTEYKLKEEFIEGIDYSNLAKYKPDNTIISLNHDMLAINEIIRLRNRQDFRRLERCKAIFVSSDNKLAKFNICEYYHQNRKTIAEVILDRILTQILWAKNPQENRLPLFSAIAAHFRALFVDKVFWEKFHKTIIAMHKKKELTNEELSLLLYSQKTEDVLVFEEHPEVINEAYIKEKLEFIKESSSKEKDEYERQIKEKESQLAATKEENLELAQKINMVKDRLNSESKRKAEIFTNIIYYTIPLVFIIIILAFTNRFSRLRCYLDFFVRIIIPILVFFGISFKTKKCKKQMEDKIRQRINKRLTKKYLDL